MNRACDMSSLWFCFIALTDSVLCWYKLFLLTTRNSHLLLSYHACLSHSCTRSLTAECTCVWAALIWCSSLACNGRMQISPESGRIINILIMAAIYIWKKKKNGCHMEEEEEWLPYGWRRRMAAIWKKKKNGCHMEEEEEKRPQPEPQEGCLGLLFQVLHQANSELSCFCFFLLCCTYSNESIEQPHNCLSWLEEEEEEEEEKNFSHQEVSA